MSQRIIRVNELLQREISAILHENWRQSVVHITIIGVETGSDLRNATVYYAVLGGEAEERNAHAFLNRVKGQIRHQLGQRVILKYMPDLRFVLDRSIAEGVRVVQLLDDVAAEDAQRAAAHPAAAPADAPKAGADKPNNPETDKPNA